MHANSYGKFRHILKSDPAVSRFIAKHSTAEEQGTSPSNGLTSEIFFDVLNAPREVKRPNTTNRLPEQKKPNRFRIERCQRIVDSNVEKEKTKEILKAALARPRTCPSEAFVETPDHDPIFEQVPNVPIDPPAQIHVNPHAREHVEAKACVLAKQYNINIKQLQQMRRRPKKTSTSKETRLDFEKVLLQGERKKTEFLLAHYMSLGKTDMTSSEEELLHDVVDEWTLVDNSSVQRVEYLWESMMEHMEASYVLNEGMKLKSKPDKLATNVAFDCLEKIADKMPQYARVLDVVTHVLEKAIYVDDLDTRLERKMYFEKAKEVEEVYQKQTADVEEYMRVKQLSYQERLVPLFNAIKNPLDQQSVIYQLIESSSKDLDVAFITKVIDHLPVSIQNDARLDLVKGLNNDYTYKILGEMFTNSSDAVAQYFGDHRPQIHGVLFSNKSIALKILEFDVQELATCLWKAPQLMSNILHAAPSILERILDHHAYMVTNILAGNLPLFLSIIANLLKDNLTLMEEHFVKNPRLFYTILSSKPELLSYAFRSDADILYEQLGPCRDVFAKVFGEHPAQLTKLFEHAPSIALELFSYNPTYLSQAMMLCPEVLSKVLQEKPLILSDVMHRAPHLLLEFIQQNPDMLLAPLEQNPSIIANFISIYPNLLTPPILDEMGLRKVNDFKISTACKYTQTEQPATASPTRLTSKLVKRKSLMLGVLASKRKKVHAWEKDAILKCIALVYAKKCQDDKADDREGFERESLANLLEDHFLQVYGLKTTSTKQLSGLLAGIKKYQEQSLRIQRFGILLGVLPSKSSARETTAIYLSFLQALLPDNITEQFENDATMVTKEMMERLTQQMQLVEIPVGLVNKFRLEYPEQLMGPIPTDASNACPTDSLSAPSGFPYHIDRVLELALHLWFRHESSVDEELFNLFKKADENGDGVLSFNEFSALVEKLVPNCDSRTMLRMFKLCGEENDVGEHEIKPTDFAVVMRIYQKKISRKMY